MPESQAKKIIAADKCAECGNKKNDFDAGGTKRCFHCFKCGYLECSNWKICPTPKV